jgi:hypothetical protein
MKKFIALKFNNLPHAAHYGFCTEFHERLRRLGPAAMAALGTLLAAFGDWLEKEAVNMAWVRDSELAAQIAEADRVLVHWLAAAAALVNSALYSSDQEVFASAERIDAMLKTYGEVGEKPYDEQAQDVLSILDRLSSDFIADVMKVGLPKRRDALQAAYDEFFSLLRSREAESLQQTAETFAAVRRGIEEVYRQIIAIIEKGAALGADPEYEALIDRSNPEIERLNTEHRKTKPDIDNARTEPVPTYGRTQKPVCPVPRAYYPTPDGEVELTPGKDFDIVYRNNINAGNAYLILRGKGAYRGSKIVRFIIGYGGYYDYYAPPPDPQPAAEGPVGDAQ